MAAPFSLPRDWQDCARCRAGNWKRYFDGEDPEAAFAPCPECSQPPRCQMGGGFEGQCPRPGTVAPFKGSGFTVCGQCRRHNDLAAEVDDWRDAKETLKGFWQVAQAVGNPALRQAIDLAFAESEMRIASINEELKVIEEWPW